MDTVTAEAAFLGAVLIDGDVLDRTELPVSAFDQPWNRALYRAMLALRDLGLTVSAVALAEHLRAQNGLEEVGGVDYIGRLQSATPTATLAEDHARLILEDYRRRRVVSFGERFLEAAKTGRATDALLKDAQSWITAETANTRSDRFPAPLSIEEGLALDDTPDAWLFEGIVPQGANVLQIGYPKSMKSVGYFDLAVSAALGQAWLRRYPAQGRFKVGILLLEGRRRFAERTIERLAIGRGASVKDLTEWLYLWHRPPLRLNDPEVIQSLGKTCADLKLDLLVLDAYGYAAGRGTNTNSDQEVLDQLQAFSSLRDHVPGLTTWLVHHARKETQDRAGTRLTDLVRGSGAFGQWFDAGLVFHRKDEQTPVSIRTEFRERTAMKPFSFVAEDEYPASIDNGGVASGWFKLTATDRTAEELVKDERAAGMVPKVVEFLRANPGAGVTEIRKGVEGDNNSISDAIDLLKRTNKIFVETQGQKICHYLSGGYRAEPC